MEFTTIKSHPDYEISKEGIIRKISTGAIKSQYINDNGYYLVSIRYGKISKPRRVHRLMAETFLDNPLNLPEINHKDGIKVHNELSNFEWCTHAENMKHANKTGLMNNRGVKNGMAKLKETDIPVIRQLLKDGVSQYKIAQRFNISRSAIENIKIRGQWLHITG